MVAKTLFILFLLHMCGQHYCVNSENVTHIRTYGRMYGMELAIAYRQQG